MSFFATYPALGSGGGGSGILSINGDTTTNQLITGGTGISVSTVAGNTTITNTGASGTVTSVSVTTANGVSGTVLNPTTTPAISLTLGAITPSSVAAVGTVTGSNLSGTNTGDQTITLTGDVTGSGTSSFAATIAANAVTNAKLAQMAAHTFKGNNTGVTANALDLTQTQLTAELNQFTTTLQGVVPGSGGGTVNFLRADGTWNAPPDTGITQLTGDVTAGPGSGSQAASLVASTNATLATLSALTTAGSLSTVGTITSGTWNATTIAINHGGTGQTTQTDAFDALAPTTTTGDLIYHNGTDNIRLGIGSTNDVLTVIGGAPSWQPSQSVPIINVRASEGAGTTTLTNADVKFQRFDLSANRTVKLPTTGVLKGDVWEMINPNGFVLSIQASDASAIIKSWGSFVQLVALVNTPVANTDWAVTSHDVLYGRKQESFSTTISNLGTTTNENFSWFRPTINTMNIYGRFMTGTVGVATQGYFALPLSLNIDTAPGWISNLLSAFGEYHLITNGGAVQIYSTANYSGVLIYDSAIGTQTVTFATQALGGAYKQDSPSSIFESNANVNVLLRDVPIAEWSEV